MWAGAKVHDCIKHSLTNLRRGISVLDVDQIIDITLNQMREEFRSSREKRYHIKPKSCVLFEHEYEVPISGDDWKKTADNMEQCLRNFYSSIRNADNNVSVEYRPGFVTLNQYYHSLGDAGSNHVPHCSAPKIIQDWAGRQFILPILDILYSYFITITLSPMITLPLNNPTSLRNSKKLTLGDILFP
jgi:hypothetical protein